MRVHVKVLASTVLAGLRYYGINVSHHSSPTRITALECPLAQFRWWRSPSPTAPAGPAATLARQPCNAWSWSALVPPARAAHHEGRRYGADGTNYSLIGVRSSCTSPRNGRDQLLHTRMSRHCCDYCSAAPGVGSPSILSAREAYSAASSSKLSATVSSVTKLAIRR